MICIKEKLLSLYILFFLMTSAGKATVKDSSYSWRYKFGIKYSAEKMKWAAMSPQSYLGFNPGIQFIVHLKNSGWSFQSGLYKTFKISENFEYGEKIKVNEVFLNLPVAMRYDYYGFYACGGVFLDYFIGSRAERIKNPLNTRSACGVTHAFGYEKRILDNWALFLESRHFLSLFEPPPHLYYTCYGISLGINCVVN